MAYMWKMHKDEAENYASIVNKVFLKTLVVVLTFISNQHPE